MDIVHFKKRFPDFFLVNISITHLIFTFISNYSIYSFILKTISGTVIVIIILSRDKNSLDKNVFSRYRLFLLFVFYISISILWSSNRVFGLLKLVNLIISVIPLLSFSFYLSLNWDDKYRQILIRSFLFIGLGFSIAALVIHPFDYKSIYVFEFGRWSHVVFGRIIGIAFILSYMRYISEDNHYIINGIVMILLLYSVYYSGTRAAFSGIIIVSLFIGGNLLLSRKFSIKISILTATTIMVASFLFIVIDNGVVLQRYLNIFSMFSRDSTDPSLSNRLDAWEDAYTLFLSHPLFGVGFGGFNNPQISELSGLLKYPHNIFIEILTETGIMGLIMFSLIFYKTIRSIKYNIWLTVFFTFFLWLSMFSKDIAGNSVLFVLLGINKGVKGDSNK